MTAVAIHDALQQELTDLESKKPAPVEPVAGLHSLPHVGMQVDREGTVMTMHAAVQNDTGRCGNSPGIVGRGSGTGRGSHRHGRSMVMTGESQRSQSAGLDASPNAFSTESFTMYSPSGTT